MIGKNIEVSALMSSSDKSKLLGYSKLGYDADSSFGQKQTYLGVETASGSFVPQSSHRWIVQRTLASRAFG